MKKVFLLCSSIGLVISLMAQESSFRRTNNPAMRYWSLSLGNSSQWMYDEAVSHVRYHGSGMAPALGLIKQSDRKYREFFFRPTFNTLSTDRANELRPMEVKTTRILLDYLYLVKVRPWNDQINLYAGADLNLLFNLKRAEQLDNSQLLYDYAFSIGAAGKLDKSVRFKKRNCIASADLKIPLIAHIARPQYLNRIEFIDPKNDFVGDLFRNSTLTCFNKYNRVITGLSFTYPLFNKNALKLGYSWDFYKMRTINSVYSAEHLVSIAFLSNY
jgi:hypothetical protein